MAPRKYAGGGMGAEGGQPLPAKKEYQGNWTMYL